MYKNPTEEFLESVKQMTYTLKEWEKEFPEEEQ